MVSIATLVIVAWSVLLLIPCVTLLIEVLAAILPSNAIPAEGGTRPSVAILIPAHNEASILAGTLRYLAPQLIGADRMVVIADNCTDETAKIARNEGAEVYVRTDAVHRGKGFALDFGVRELGKSPPSVVIIVDADCETCTGTIDILARMCARLQRPVQALYLMKAPISSGTKLKIAEFAWTLRNKVRPLGLLNLGMPCHLTGSGMAFPWHQLLSVNLATGHITEDLAFGIELAGKGVPPLYCPQALVLSEFPTSISGAAQQRTRWEHGHLALILSEFPSLLRLAIRRLDPRLVALALDLCVPPLALATLLCFALFILAFISVVLIGVHAQWLMVAAVPPCLLIAAVLLAWRTFGRDTLSFGELASFILYSFRKAPVYARFVLSRQTSWVRSKRNNEADD